MDLKKIILDCINFKIDGVNFENLVVESASADKGDFCLPCFSLSKILHDNPNNIAKKVEESLTSSPYIERTEVLNGYLNFFLNKEEISRNILEKFDINSFTESKNGKIVCIDYASPNLAKYLHIGHLKTTIIGESLARLFTQCGYTVKRLNFVGDYGTPFGKIIGGMLKWGSIEDVKARGNDALQEYYVRFNKEEEKDESLQQYARDIFKKIEDKDSEIYPIYEFIIKIALEDANNMFKTLGVSFDDYRGENYYNQFIPQEIELLKNKGLLKTSENAQIVDLSAFDMPPAVILKNDGTSLYLTRDIIALILRHEEYNFDKILYVTDVAQKLHFQQLKKVIELLGFDYFEGIEHVAYGRFSLPDGKISSRRGKQAVLVDFIEYIEQKARSVIEGRTFNIEKPEDVVNKVAKAVLNFSVLKIERTKDCVFDTEKAFSFDGETAPYMLYTYTRLASILRKAENEKNEQIVDNKKTDVDYSTFNEDAFSLIKNINNFSQTIHLALSKRDPSIVSNKVMDMCKTFNKYYVGTKILDGNPASTKAKLTLVSALKDVLNLGFNLICIDPLEEM